MSRRDTIVPGLTHGCVTVISVESRDVHGNKRFNLRCACGASFARSHHTFIKMLDGPPCTDCPVCRAQHPGLLRMQRRRREASPAVKWGHFVQPNPEHKPNRNRCPRCEDMPWRRTNHIGTPLTACLSCGKPYAKEAPPERCSTLRSSLCADCKIVW